MQDGQRLVRGDAAWQPSMQCRARPAPSGAARAPRHATRCARTPNISTAPRPANSTARRRKAAIISDDCARRSIHRTCALPIAATPPARAEGVSDTAQWNHRIPDIASCASICIGVVPQQRPRRASPSAFSPRVANVNGEALRAASTSVHEGIERMRAKGRPACAASGSIATAHRKAATLGALPAWPRCWAEIGDKVEIRRSRRLPPSVAIPGAELPHREVRPPATCR